MRAYIVATGLRIHPFGDPVGETPILNRPLREWQEWVFRRNGIEPVFQSSLPEVIDSVSRRKETDFFLTWDNVFISPRLFQLFKRRSEGSGATQSLAIRKSTLTEYTRHMQDLGEGKDEKGEFLVYHFYRVRAPGGALDPSALTAARPLPIEMREYSISWRLGRGTGLPSTEMPVTGATRVAMEIQSWFHILQVNLVSLPVSWAVYLRNPLRCTWMIFKLLYGAVTVTTDFALGLIVGRPPRLSAYFISSHALSMANRIGTGTCIHPTAVVLGSVIGKDVNIGPFAYVAFSIIGDGTKIAPFSQVRDSVIGPRCDLIRIAIVNGCVAYPEARIWRVQLSVLGRGSNFGGEARAYDVKLTGPIEIEHNGQLVSTGTNSLGLCLGHGAAVWGDVSIQYGRVIPNNYTIVENQDNVIQKIPPDLPTDEPLMSLRSTVVPVSEWKSGKRAKAG